MPGETEETISGSAQASAEAGKETKPSTIVTDPPAGETKPQTPAAEPEVKKEEPKAPDKYELSLPDDSPLAESVLESTEKYAREKKLSNDQAQELVNQKNQAVVDHLDAAKAVSEGWIKEVQDDKELGGDNFKESSELAKRAVDHFGSEAFKEALLTTGLGNHPELVRTFMKIGKAMAEDTLVHPGKAAGKELSAAEKLYDKTEQKKE